MTEEELQALEAEIDALDTSAEPWTQQDLDRRDEIAKILDAEGRW